MFFRIIFLGLAGLFAMMINASAASPYVVVSMAPLHSIVSAVTDGVTEPVLLLSPAVSVHDFHLKPSDIKRLSQADIVFWGGPELETGLVKALEAVENQDKNVPILKDSRLTLYPAREDDHHDEIDGHFWLMPENMETVALIVAEALTRIDPDNGRLYRENADRVQKRLAALKNKGKDILAPYKRKPYVVFHEAYQYFEKSFDLPSLGALFTDPHHAAGALRITEMREKIKQAGTVCVFSEPQFSDKKIKAAAEGLSVVFGELDPVGSALAPGKEFYPELMERLIRSFKDCLDRLPEE